MCGCREGLGRTLQIAVILEAEECVVKDVVAEERSCMFCLLVCPHARKGPWLTDIENKYFLVEFKPLKLTDRS